MPTLVRAAQCGPDLLSHLTPGVPSPGQREASMTSLRLEAQLWDGGTVSATLDGGQEPDCYLHPCESWQEATV